MNQAINEMEVTAEEVEAMDALCRLGAGVPLLNISDGGRVVQYATPPSAEVLHKTEPQQSQLDPQKIIDEMMVQFSISLKLLLTVINQTKAQPTQGNSLNAEDQSLQECVNLTLQRAEWFKEMVEEKVDELVDDMDHTYGIESAVSRLEELVEDKLADLVSEKLSNLRITFD